MGGWLGKSSRHLMKGAGLSSVSNHDWVLKRGPGDGSGVESTALPRRDRAAAITRIRT